MASVRVDEWKEIKEFPGYSVSQHGEVRNDSTGRRLSLKVNQYKVVYVGLMRGYKQYQRSVALLVATAFIPRPFGPMDTPINLNGDRFDNRVANLVWRPRWFAVQYNRQFRVPYDNPIVVPIQDIESGMEYESSFDAAIAHGLLERDVVLSVLNRAYTWPTYQQFRLVEN